MPWTSRRHPWRVCQKARSEMRGRLSTRNSTTGCHGNFPISFQSWKNSETNKQNRKKHMQSRSWKGFLSSAAAALSPPPFCCFVDKKYFSGRIPDNDEDAEYLQGPSLLSFSFS